MKNFTLIFLTSVMSVLNALAQVPVTDLYQYNYTSVSPAFAGLDGQKITMMGNYLKTKGDAAITSGFIGYEINADKINSGFGLTLSHGALGPQSDTFINLLYNYQFRINDKSKLVIGTKFTDHIFSVDFSQYRSLDANDPLIDTDQPQTTSNFMFGLAALYKTDRFFIGVSTDNIATSVIRESKLLPVDATDKLFHYTAGVNFKISQWLSSTHSVYGLTSGDYWRVDLNNTFTFVNWIMVGVSLEKIDENDNMIANLNAGIKLKERGQLVALFYSSDDPFPTKFKMQAMLQFKL